MMTNEEIFESQLNPAGSFAGVYEYEEEVGYFYLYDVSKNDGHKVVSAIRVATGPAAHSSAEVEIRWSADEKFVGLLIRERLCAAFDVKSHVAFCDGSEQAFTIPDFVVEALRIA